ncbi:hypothetical protein Hbal_1000 [Hirschia baltica ATCC 49814]|uniref:Uncharacterized protein n=1 Tax=Hirschia baltica (strain ATCC 49814 / DSM 5838 / IFAM 1418) TaxID=582402 RepID=C6XQT8_HIRBI|nr:hypothetical protein Hbal_1000 [Hirschia baltica ATCC 49814]
MSSPMLTGERTKALGCRRGRMLWKMEADVNRKYLRKRIKIGVFAVFDRI